MHQKLQNEQQQHLAAVHNWQQMDADYRRRCVQAAQQAQQMQQQQQQMQQLLDNAETAKKHAEADRLLIAASAADEELLIEASQLELTEASQLLSRTGRELQHTNQQLVEAQKAAIEAQRESVQLGLQLETAAAQVAATQEHQALMEHQASTLEHQLELAESKSFSLASQLALATSMKERSAAEHTLLQAKVAALELEVSRAAQHSQAEQIQEQQQVRCSEASDLRKSLEIAELQLIAHELQAQLIAHELQAQTGVIEADQEEKQRQVAIEAERAQLMMSEPHLQRANQEAVEAVRQLQTEVQLREARLDKRESELDRAQETVEYAQLTLQYLTEHGKAQQDAAREQQLEVQNGALRSELSALKVEEDTGIDWMGLLEVAAANKRCGELEWFAGQVFH